VCWESQEFVLPIDSIDQFSVANAGSTGNRAATRVGRSDLALRSGGNSFHGSAYEYIRNEAFARPHRFPTPRKKIAITNTDFPLAGHC